MFESEESRILTAGLLSFRKPDCLANDGFNEYTFNLETGKIRNTRNPESHELSDEIVLNKDNVLDYNIKHSLFDTFKNCTMRICTRPAEFMKFDMVCNLRTKQSGIIITKDELDNEFLIYYPVLGTREWEHASNLEFVYRPTQLVTSNAKSIRI